MNFNDFRTLIIKMQGKSKQELHWLFNERHCPIPEWAPELKEFDFGEGLKFWFEGTSHRTSEKLLLYVQIPEWETVLDEECVLYENYLLSLISPVIKGLSSQYENLDKNVREKAQFETQETGKEILLRSGIKYDKEKMGFVLRINFNVPLVNAVSVNAKATVSAIKDIMRHIEETIKNIDKNNVELWKITYRHQCEIRKYMSEKGVCAFVADGSILPRENGTVEPMVDATPFSSPEDMRIKIDFSDGTHITGMAIPTGITVITGGGYSGKSTLLNAIEMGIYDHIPGDGREYVITERTALKIYAEDGRPISELDISAFFRFMSGKEIPKKFSTLFSSGSVSQAANIIEAVYGGVKTLLIDEDRSATNFMIRDEVMRKIIKHDSIIPFTDRVRELSINNKISTILVIGGSSEYFKYADTAILMEDYKAKNITSVLSSFKIERNCCVEEKVCWVEHRRIAIEQINKPFNFFSSVKTENEKKIVLDEYTSDITQMSSIISSNQIIHWHIYVKNC